jgi:hypothetical protein
MAVKKARQAATTSSTEKKPRAVKLDPAPVMPDFQITKPENGSTKGGDKLIVEGFESQAARVRSLQIEMDDIEADLKARKSALIAAVSKIRKDQELAGDFHKTCAVASDDGLPVLICWQDKYSKIDVKHEEVLRTAFDGDKAQRGRGKEMLFDSLFARGFDLKVRSSTTLDAIKTLLGDKYDDFCTLVEMTEYLTPAKSDKIGFMEQRFLLRKTLTDQQNAAADLVIDQCQNAPQVKVK